MAERGASLPGLSASERGVSLRRTIDGKSTKTRTPRPAAEADISKAQAQQQPPTRRTGEQPESRRAAPGQCDRARPNQPSQRRRGLAGRDAGAAAHRHRRRHRSARSRRPRTKAASSAPKAKTDTSSELVEDEDEDEGRPGRARRRISLDSDRSAGPRSLGSAALSYAGCALQEGRLALDLAARSSAAPGSRRRRRQPWDSGPRRSRRRNAPKLANGLATAMSASVSRSPTR